MRTTYPPAANVVWLWLLVAMPMTGAVSAASPVPTAAGKMLVLDRETGRLCHRLLRSLAVASVLTR